MSCTSNDSEIVVRLSTDGMQAFIKIFPPKGNGAEATFEDALNELKKKKVVYGIDEETLRDIVLSRRYNEEFLIAKGTQAIPGKDGRVRYFFDPDYKVKLEKDERGNIDFRELGLIRSVTKGTKLAEILLTTPGTPGTNVKGEKVPPKEGKPANLPKGKNTMPHPEHCDVLIAAEDGAIFFKSDSIIDIEPICTIQGDVNFITGNIEHIGSVMVQGDVKSTFKIKADGDVDIAGVIEDAEIEASGQVVLQKGIVGKGKGCVKADGNVCLKYCKNQKIITKADVYVSEGLLNSYVITGGRVIVSGKNGVIIGGNIFAARGIEVNTLGNYQHTRTNVIVGVNEETHKKLDEIKSNIKKNKKNMKNIGKAIRELGTQIATYSLPPSKIALLEKLRKVYSEIEDRIIELTQQKEELEKEYEQYKDARVKVLQKVYPGVHIRIQRDEIIVNEKISDVYYYLDGNHIRQKRSSI